MGNIPTTNPTTSDYKYWRYKPNNYIVLTASGTVKLTDGILSGLFVSAGTPTIKVWDSKLGAAGAALVESFVSVAATRYPIPETHFKNGCFVSLTNAGTVTVFYK